MSLMGKGAVLYQSSISMGLVGDAGSRCRYQLFVLPIQLHMLGYRVKRNDEHIGVLLAIESSELVLLMCPKSIGRFHPKFAHMLEFIHSLQLVLVAREVIWLPQGFQSMDFVIVGCLFSQITVILLETVVLLVGIRHIVVISVCSGWSGCLCLSGRSLLPFQRIVPKVLRPMLRPV